jgi:hypothetical protein
LGLLIALGATFPSGCGNGSGSSSSESASNARSPEETASACESADQCFAGVDGLMGEPLCLDRVRGGHCTHTCSEDSDCCAASGECDTDLDQVCAPFESTGQMMCFLSCESADVRASAYDDDAAYCQNLVNSEFICRSSGGGANNRKICVPGACGVGANCSVDDDCASGLQCETGLPSGYCTEKGCKSSDDCSGDEACVRSGGVAFCAKPCNAASDCSFCRQGTSARCEASPTFVGAAHDGSYCIPE